MSYKKNSEVLKNNTKSKRTDEDLDESSLYTFSKVKSKLKTILLNLLNRLFSFFYKKIETFINKIIFLISNNKIITVCLIFMIAFGYTQYKHNIKINTKLTEIKEVAAEKEKEKKNLEKEVKFLSENDKYLINYARKHYVFIKDNENVVSLPNMNNYSK